jgi:hypothetical protein
VSESVGRCNVEKADHRHPRLLRAGGERPGRHTAESFDEIAPPHSITSSARAMSVTPYEGPDLRFACRPLLYLGNVG